MAQDTTVGTTQIIKTRASKKSANVENTSKSYLAALALSYLTGSFGVDRFYLGYIATGVIKLVTFGGLGVWSLIDLLLVAFGKLREKGNPAPLEGFTKHSKSLKIIALIVVIFHALTALLFISLFVFTTITGLAQANDNKTYDRAAQLGDAVNSYVNNNAVIPDDLDAVQPGGDFTGITYTKVSDTEYRYCVTYQRAGSFQLENNAEPQMSENYISLPTKHGKGLNCLTVKPLDGVVGQNIKQQNAPAPSTETETGCGATTGQAQASGNYSVFSTEGGNKSVHFAARNGGSTYVISSKTKIFDRNCQLQTEFYLAEGDQITAYGPTPSSDVYNPSIPATVVVDFAVR